MRVARMVTTAVIVQARMRSSRLPGKVLLSLGSETVLHEVLKRCMAISAADCIVCAVPDDAECREIERIATSCGALVFRGSEKDVLSRYLGAADAANADVVLRVTSDCPLIDPAVCENVLKLRQTENVDYAANNLVRTFPHGLDCEAFTRAALAQSAAATNEPYDREHVTPWLRRSPDITRANLAATEPSHAHERWTLDYPEDLAFFRAVFAKLPVGPTGGMADVLAVLAAHPEFRDINARHRETRKES